MRNYAKSREINNVMGDWNAEVGEEHAHPITGNDRGQRLAVFRWTPKLVIANTLLKHPERRLYIWRSPGDVLCDQTTPLLHTHFCPSWILVPVAICTCLGPNKKKITKFSSPFLYRERLGFVTIVNVIHGNFCE